MTDENMIIVDIEYRVMICSLQRGSDFKCRYRGIDRKCHVLMAQES